MNDGQKVLIIGGVAGGASTAPRLRRLDEHAQIIMFERGEYVSFANCGLPYYIGGEIQKKESLTVQKPEDFREKFNIDVRILNEVTSIHPSEKTISVKNLATGELYTESYDKLVISTGAEPVKPPIQGIDSDKVFTLRNIPDTYRIKDYIEQQQVKSAVVMGGGFIGIEMAENLKNAGLSVTLVEMSDQVLAPIDPDMAAEVHQHIRSKGVRLELKNGVKSIIEEGSSLKIQLNHGFVHADMLILAIGVRPDTGLAKAAGIALNDRGAIIVNEHMKTSDPFIYAVGDAIEITDSVTGQKGYVPLAGPANKQGRIVADNLCGIKTSYKGTQGSSILKVFDLTVASTGINEKTAKRLNLPYDKVFTYSGNHAGYYPAAVNMAIKTIFNPEDGKILGAQIVGYDGVDKRCDVMAVAIRAGMNARDLCDLELSYAPPYNSAKDPVNMAGFVIENIVTGKIKQVHWHDIPRIQEEKNAIRIDVRTPIEFENGHIDKFINIPLAELRERLTELDSSKILYVSCQIGLKAYIASRILIQNGFQVWLVDGGYRLYHSIFGEQQTNSTNLKTENQIEEPTLKASSSTLEPHIDAIKDSETIYIDACGLSCPGPIVKLSSSLKEINDGDIIEISTSDPAFASDIEGFCRRTGHNFLGLTSEKGISTARIRKCPSQSKAEMIYAEKCHVSNTITPKDSKNIIVFSGDLDKAIASFIIANAAAAMGRHVSMFFTFWGLNILRKPEKVPVKKNFMSRMFSQMMPRGSQKLGLSKMNMGGMGAKMIRGVMKDKNISSLEDLITLAQQNGVELVACSMSMDVMGITEQELIDGVKMGGAAAMLANAEESDMSLFI